MIRRVLHVAALLGAPANALLLTAPRTLPQANSSTSLNLTRANTSSHLNHTSGKRTGATNGTAAADGAATGQAPLIAEADRGYSGDQALGYDDVALRVDGQLVVPLGEDGKFILDERIQVVFIDVGVFSRCDFEGEILNDPSLLVIGIEANPDMIHRQEFRHEQYKLFQFAVGKSDGYATLHLTAEPACSSILVPNYYLDGSSLPSWVKEGCANTLRNVTVPMRRLEKFMQRIPAHLKIGWLKTDCQGYDLEVIASIGTQMHRVSKLQYEVQDVADGSFRNLYNLIPSFHTVNRFVTLQGFHEPTCTTNNPVQDVLHEFDCVTCRNQPPVDCYRKP